MKKFILLPVFITFLCLSAFSQDIKNQLTDKPRPIDSIEVVYKKTILF